MRIDDPQENSKRYFRSADRVFMVNGAWYFAAREGDQGPHSNREIACREMVRYTSEKSELSVFQKSRDEEVHLSLVPKSPRRLQIRQEGAPLQLEVMI